MGTKEPFFLDGSKPKESCNKNEFSGESILTQINESDKKLDNSTNIIGFYRRMIRDFLHDATKYKDIEVKAAFNATKEEDFANPVVTINRERLASNNLGIIGDKKNIHDALPDAIPGYEKQFPDMLMAESNVYSDHLTISASIQVFGQHSAEVEAISQKIFQLLFAMSFDALRETFPFIVTVAPPVLGPVQPLKKFDTIYSASLSLEITITESSILFMKKNLIKYAKVLVRENLEENVILNFEPEAQ